MKVKQRADGFNDNLNTHARIAQVLGYLEYLVEIHSITIGNEGKIRTCTICRDHLYIDVHTYLLPLRI